MEDTREGEIEVEPYYWWYPYGRFAPGDHNLPCAGEVLSYYLHLREQEISKYEVRTMFPWTERYTQMLTSQKNRSMPESLPRRIFLCKVLHIPPALLGLNALALAPVNAMLVEADVVASPASMQFYERLLAVSWELYYTSSVEKAAHSITDCLQLLDQEAVNASGVRKDQYDALRCRFYQLCSLVARDRLALDQSLAYEHQAVEIALRLKNAELIAASLLRRARIYIKQRAYEPALTDAHAALPYANLSRDPLKGKCYQMAGEAAGYCAGPSRTKQQQSLAYFDVAAKIARKGDLTPDGSFVKTDITSISIEKAEALISFGRFEEAQNALAIARKQLSPEQTRWKVNLVLAEAEMYLAQREISSCGYSLLDALEIARAVHLQGKELRIRALADACRQIDATNLTLSQLDKRLQSA